MEVFSLAPLVGSSLVSLGLAYAALRLGQPRLGRAEVLLLTLLVGLLAALTPVSAFAPLWLGVGLLAVWPKRALLVVFMGGGVALICAAFGTFDWPSLQLFTPALLAASVGIALLLTAYQLYHWRWWPPLRQLAVGLTGASLLLASAALGTWAWPQVVGTLLLPLPLWAILIYGYKNYR